MPSPNGTTRVDFNKYKLIDGQLVATSGRSYGDIVGEHLHRNPSLETSKSSVELEQGMVTKNRVQKTEFFSSEKYEEVKQYQFSSGKRTDGITLNDKEVMTNGQAQSHHTHQVREVMQEDHSYIDTSTHHHQTEMYQSSSVHKDVNQKHNMMSYVESAKLRDQQQKTSQENQNTKTLDDKVEVRAPEEFKPVARSTSTSSSSSSSSGYGAANEIGPIKPGAAGKNANRHDSDSSLSNEEIVRQHLKQFNDKDQKVNEK